jgi:hypothetical protein
MDGKKLILLFLFMVGGLTLWGQSTYTYIDPCTGVTVTIPLQQGGVTMSYGGQVQFFTYAQLQSGAYGQWVNGINASFPPGTDPCAGQGEEVTNNFNTNLGSNTANTITGIVSMAASLGTSMTGAASTAGGISSSAGSGMSTGGGSSNNDNNDNGGSSNGSNNNSGGSSSSSGTNNGGNSSGSSSSGGSNGSSSGSSSNGGNSGNGGSSGGSSGSSGGGGSTGGNGGSSGGSSGGSGGSGGGSTGGSGGGGGSTDPGSGVGGTDNTSGAGGTAEGGGEVGAVGDGTTTTTSGGDSESSGDSGGGGGGGKPKSKQEKVGRGALIGAGDFVIIRNSANIQDTGVDNFKFNMSLTHLNTKQTFIKGINLNYQTGENVANVTLYGSYKTPSFMGIFSNSTMSNFTTDWFNTTSLMAAQKVKSVTGMVGTNFTYGYLGKGQFSNWSIIGGGFTNFKGGKSFGANILLLGVYSPYIFYYEGQWYKSGILLIPMMNTDFKVSDSFKWSISFSGVYQYGADILNWQLSTGTKILL